MKIIALLFAFQLASVRSWGGLPSKHAQVNHDNRYNNELKKVKSAAWKAFLKKYSPRGRAYFTKKNAHSSVNIGVNSVEQELFEVRNSAGSTLASDISQLSLSRFVTLKEAKSYLKEFCFSQLQKSNAAIIIEWENEQWDYDELLSDTEQKQYRGLTDHRKLCIQHGLYEAYKEQQHALLNDRCASPPVHHDVFRKTVKEDRLWKLLSAYHMFSSDAIDWQGRLILQTYLDVLL